MDFRKLYKNEKGACASCVDIRSFINGETIRDERVILPYDGGKLAVCVHKPNIVTQINETPNLNAPINACWHQ